MGSSHHGRNAVSDAGDRVAGVAEAVLNVVAEASSDLVETIGTGAEDALRVVAGFAVRVRVADRVLAGFLRWMGCVVAGTLGLVAATVKAGFAVIAGAVGGTIRILLGAVGLDRRRCAQGALDVASGVAGAAIVVVGTAVALIQACLFLQRIHRPLTDTEKEALRAVFRRSVALRNVRVVEGFAGILGVNRRPFTLCNTIFLKRVDPSMRPEVLVHECTHVWQYQHGGSRYAADALGAQAFVENPYSWQAEIARGRIRWEQFNAEAQAQLLEDLHEHGSLGAANDHAELYMDGANHSALAAQALDAVRARPAWRLSSLW